MTEARKVCLLPVLLAVLTLGCGTTRVSDTSRTATEQLLISNSVDEAVSEMDFTLLAGKPVFFDPQYLDGVVDKGYIISSLRQHLLASGCLLQDDRANAQYVVEARAGAVGTDRKELLFGVPSMSLPGVFPGVPAGPVPEVPLAKKTDRKGVAKIAVFAYNRMSGQPVWQSGVVQTVSTSKDTWMFGAGPYEKGTLHEGTKRAGHVVQVPLRGDPTEAEQNTALRVVPVTQAAAWRETPLPATTAVVQKPAQPNPLPSVYGGVQQAGSKEAAVAPNP